MRRVVTIPKGGWSADGKRLFKEATVFTKPWTCVTVTAEPVSSEVDALFRVFKSVVAPGTVDSVCREQIIEGVSKRLNDSYLSMRDILGTKK